MMDPAAIKLVSEPHEGEPHTLPASSTPEHSAPEHSTPEHLVPDHYFDRGVSLDVIRHHFRQGKHTLRIAVGFFTVRGYNLFRRSTEGKKVLLLVGIEEPGEQRARLVLVRDILLDLRTGLDADRRQSVENLVAKMERGDLRLIDARALDHHAKLYIVDEDVALVASANASGRGLLAAIEAGAVVTDPAAVRGYVSRYDHHFNAPGCIDITSDLVAALKGWLQFTQPWDIYLKTLAALKSLDETRLQRATYKKPVSYQRDVVARALRQIETHGGAMVVASTGLGKTVIGADIALRLQEKGLIRNVLLIGPKATRSSWESHLRSAGLSYDYFVRQALDVADSTRNQDVTRLDAVLKTMDSDWLIIVDESQAMRNRFGTTGFQRRGPERLVFRRLAAAVREARCKVLLLTGTPYSKEVDDVNNQLFLLPHTGPLKDLFGDLPDSHAWQVSDLADLREAPISSVITTPYVARHYGSVDENGLYLDFGGERRYIPRVLLFRTDFSPVVAEAVTRILEERVLRTTNPLPLYATNIESTLRVAWASSPWALRDVVVKSLHTPGPGGYKMPFRNPDACYARLHPLLQDLNALAWEDDPKLLSLCALLDHVRQEDATEGDGLATSLPTKIIIFTEQRATVAYLAQALRALRPDLCVASTIVQKQEGHYMAKPFAEVLRLLSAFAPVANERSAEDKENSTESYDVFLTTDAMGVGVNMQDARVVINYDLAWTAIEPAQRAGRVLRFWPAPRTVELHVFVPQMPDREGARRNSDLLRRWQTLIARHSQSRRLLVLPTLAIHGSDLIDMEELATEELGTTELGQVGGPVLLGELDLSSVTDAGGEEDVSTVFRHAAVLEKHKARAYALTEDLSSARLYNGSDLLVYVLLRQGDHYHWPVYDIRRRRLRAPLTDTSLLDLIVCTEEEPPAWVAPEEVEAAADACIRAWCADTGTLAEEVTRLCTLYLKPRSGDHGAEPWLLAGDQSAMPA